MSGIIGGIGARSGVIGKTDVPGGYEEGDWTPTYRGSAFIAGSVTIDKGHYIRIGNFVQCWCRCYGSSGYDANWQECYYYFDLPFTRVTNLSVGLGGIGAGWHGSGANRISQGQVLDGGGDTSRTIYYIRQNEVYSTHGSAVNHFVEFKYYTDQA